MQKGEWLPFSRRFSFYILHSAFYISTPGARRPLLRGEGRVRGNGAHAKGECRRKNEECRKGNGSRSAGYFHSAFYILHSSFFILPFHSLGEGEWGSLFVEVATDDLEEGLRGKGLLEEAALDALEEVAVLADYVRAVAAHQDDLQRGPLSAQLLG